MDSPVLHRGGGAPLRHIEWERREARITNWKDGTDAFFQPDVEFPVHWSQNATNIVAQKYFRGTLGTPERETSLKQVIDRVADTITDFVQGMRDNALVIPPPSDRVAAWPFVGEKLHAAWQLAATDLPALLQKLQPKIGDLAKGALGFVANMGGSMLAFLFSFIVAGIIMAYGKQGAESMRAISRRIIGVERGSPRTVGR